MSRVCEICQKRYLKGNLVPRGIGQRVTNRAIKKQRPNIRTKRIEIGGQKIKLRICASCVKRMKFDLKKAEELSKAE
ncbi:hypothetical protein A2V49_03470 [candidate division WWE3 bacterium RBG_19FT_COMBO_34_6]|uniref:50S ribosomal protein L28 n=1 Tax=candidate division WWE3 bacterium RBG_19FT_COMBO_34_6 TaxID=1802612 RepID=A0A1F4UKG6_UNCKA|nr:MAG: hypothetical protein A2V49_03470 [candidate division WWE3 bacterium RBG_19FT_COMBO_34_6]